MSTKSTPTENYRRAANKFIYWLLRRGFLIERYNAYTTNSIYLQLDYGLAGKVRLSDHLGHPESKREFPYQWIENLDHAYVEGKGKNRCRFYSASDLKTLSKDILKHRAKSIEMHGEIEYMKIMGERKKYRYGFFAEKGFTVNEDVVKAELKARELLAQHPEQTLAFFQCPQCNGRASIRKASPRETYYAGAYVKICENKCFDTVVQLKQQ